MSVFCMTFGYMNENTVLKAQTYKMDKGGRFMVGPDNKYVVDQPAEFMNAWAVVKNTLETTDDFLLWTYNYRQEPNFNKMVKKYGLEKFIVAQSPKLYNPNYNEKRVFTCVMKGKKQ